jgi:hypothetical protein
MHGPLVPPSQQPAKHVLGSQEQVPVVVSQTPLVQSTHAAPLVPHFAADSEAYGTHVLPLQQPLGHVVPLQTHTPPLHSCPVAHAEQLAPSVPQEPFD